MKGLALVLVCCLVFAVSVQAQTAASSQIKGTVRDSSGAAVPGATVVVTQTATGLVRTTLSGSDGSYFFPELPTGPYQLEVTVPGFSKYVQTGIVMQVGSNPTIEVSLKVGNITEQVTVEANASMVETQTLGVGQLTDAQRVVELPLIGRQVTDLVLLSGAASPGSDGFMLSGNRYYPNTVQISVAGGLAMGTTYMLDGALHNDMYNNAGLPLPFPDALQEFKIETSALPAQYGMHSAAAVNAVTKSGTNDWHGTLFEFVRNYKFNARNYFSPTRDSLKRNQFGGSVGGPIKKNKLFFFASFQQTDTRQDPNQVVTFVPTQAMLNGDFTVYASAQCQATGAKTLKAPFVGNKIALSQMSPQALYIAKLLPTSGDPCGRITYGARVIDDERFGVAKVDYQLSNNNTLFARYLGTHDGQPVPYTFGNNLLTTNSPGWDDMVQSATIGDTHTFGSNMVNSFRLTMDRGAIARLGAQFFSPQDAGINIFSYLPKYTSISVTGGFSIGMSMATDAHFRTTTGQLGDDLSLVHGNHQMVFGVSLVHVASNGYANVNAAAPMTFNGGVTGLGYADFFTGNLFQLSDGAPTEVLGRIWYMAMYAQDAWKARRNLTVNYGLRWEPWFPMSFANNRVYHFDMNSFINGTRTTQFTNAPPGLFYPGDPGFPGSNGINKQWKQFAPRFGIVWDPKGDGRMSIRASYGIFYDFVPVEYHLNTVASPPWGGFTQLNNPPGGLANPWQGQPGGNPFPFTVNQNAPYTSYATYAAFNYNTRSTYVQQWNLSIQKQIGKDWMVSAAYMGNEMTHLYGGRELNPAAYGPGATGANMNSRRLFNTLNPTYGKYFGYVDLWDDGGTGSFNGMLLTATRRLARGMTLNANYTYSHCIGNPANSVINSGNGGMAVYMFPGHSLDRGNCNTSATDRRHVANITAIGQMPKFSNSVMNALASGWRASASVAMATGNWLTVLSGLDAQMSGVPTSVQRASQVLPNVYGDGTIGNFLNPKAFAQPTTGTIGNLGPGTIQGPGSLNVNTSVARIFRVRERQTLEIRAEAQNLLNTANFSAPSVTLTSNTFGQITAAAPGRIIQFAFKYLF